MKVTKYLIKLYKGDIPLYITFWIFGMLIGHLLMTLVNTVVNLYMYQIIVYELQWLILLIFIILMLYNIFILIAIWRSSNKYQGKKSNRELAKLCIVFSIYGMVSILYNKLYV